MTLKRLSARVLLTVLISWPLCSYSSDFVFYCAPWKEIKNKRDFKRVHMAKRRVAVDASTDDRLDGMVRVDRLAPVLVTRSEVG